MRRVSRLSILLSGRRIHNYRQCTHRCYHKKEYGKNADLYVAVRDVAGNFKDCVNIKNITAGTHKVNMSVLNFSTCILCMGIRWQYQTSDEAI